ncbi:MAG TPA: four-carbon acid sugar kinase family protein [Nocardioidaceae bacterium]|nr:four-carbon acid sugar kinase family protein [Nocardioidaceae bacterium]
MTQSPTGTAAGEVVEALVVADDLTGAADTAVAFAAAGLPTQVAFAGTQGAHRGQAHRAPAVLALDTDSRRRTARDAAAAVTAALRAAPPARLRMKKIDSTLRGNIGAETTAALDLLGGSLALCAPAFPAAGRQTRGGAQWAVGSRIGDVSACFTGLRVVHVGLDAVRAGRCHEELLPLSADEPTVAVVDAETDEDLQQVVRAGTALPHDVLWVGSGGLGAALASVTSPPGSGRPPRNRPAGLPVAGAALAVVGSATTVATAQADTLVAAGAAEVAVPAGALLDAEAGRFADRAAGLLVDGRDVVVRIAADGRIEPGHGRRVVEALGTALAPVVTQASPAAIVATGGETALTLALATGAHGLDVLAELEPGVVHSTLTGGPGTTVVTKAGAFGDAGTLVRALGTLRAGTDHEQERLR